MRSLSLTLPPLLGLLLLTSMPRANAGGRFAGSEPRFENLVKVTLAGTRIDVAPHHVAIIVTSPRRAARETRRVMSKNSARLLRLLGTSFLYQTPAQWSQPELSFKPELDDVIYGFRFASEAERAAFARRHRLRLHQSAKPRTGSGARLYRASPHFFVLAQVASRLFTCPMHPPVKRVGKSTCPICGMDLVPTRP